MDYVILAVKAVKTHRNLPYLRFEAVYYKPKYNKYRCELCYCKVSDPPGQRESSTESLVEVGI